MKEMVYRQRDGGVRKHWRVLCYVTVMLLVAPSILTGMSLTANTRVSLTVDTGVTFISAAEGGRGDEVSPSSTFSGTATTPLCAAYAGDVGTGVEINPFLTWLGNAKLAAYRPSCLHAARRRGRI